MSNLQITSKLLGVSVLALLVCSCSSSKSFFAKKTTSKHSIEQPINVTPKDTIVIEKAEPISLEEIGIAELVIDSTVLTEEEQAEKLWGEQCIFTEIEKISVGSSSKDFFVDSESVTLDLDYISKNARYPFDGVSGSDFGFRSGRAHNGIDISARNGAKEIYSFMGGVVRMSTYVRGFGNTIVIRHYNGLETIYAHSSKRLVKSGDVVCVGQQIAIVGSTGRSTGPHLHFEIRVNGKPINPNFFVDPKTRSVRTGAAYIHRFDKQLILASYESDRSKVIVKRYHKIRSGDTLSRLSNRYGISINNLCKLNNIKSTSILKIGQQVRVA